MGYLPQFLPSKEEPLSVYDFLFHDLDERGSAFRFVAVLSDGVEQYVSMPSSTYQKLYQDVNERLYTSGRDFIKIDMEWAHEAFSLLHSVEQ